MANNEEQLKILHQKVHQLVKQYNTLQKENSSLKKELEKKNLLAAANIAQAEKLQQQLDSLNLGSNVWNEEDKMLLQKRVNAYLKEIDKCLQLLNH
jgi:SMC interacting uncharacterized protein involved in chromosome segregation